MTLRAARARSTAWPARSGIGLHQADLGCFEGDVGAGAHGEGEVGLGERGGVVDAVADHCDSLSGVADFFDDRCFFFGESSGSDVCDANLIGDGPRGLLGVAADDHGVRRLES